MVTTCIHSKSILWEEQSRQDKNCIQNIGNLGDTQNGGFKAVVMGKEVCVKVWIHFLIGDTEGFNKWLGHYLGNRKEISCPYRDCKCNFYQLSDPNPTCEYVTMDEMREAKRLKNKQRK